MPRWLLARPHLHAAVLGWINVHRRNRALLPAVMVATLGVLALLALPTVGMVLESAAQNPVIPFVILAAGSSMLTARRKAYVYQDLHASWLASLAAPNSVAIRMIVPAVGQLLFLALVVSVPVIAGSLSHSGGATLAGVMAAAHAAGFAVGWFSPRDKTVGAPDFHYVAVRKPRPSWSTAPQLSPLSFWTVGQARVSTKPKATAKALIFVLLAIPLGTPGEKVIAIGAGAVVTLYLFALAISAARVAVAAARWLSVTTVRYAPFTWALGRGVLLAQLWTLAWVVFFVLMVSVPVAWSVGRMALECVVVSCVVIVASCWLAMRAAGMRP